MNSPMSHGMRDKYLTVITHYANILETYLSDVDLSYLRAFHSVLHDRGISFALVHKPVVLQCIHALAQTIQPESKTILLLLCHHNRMNLLPCILDILMVRRKMEPLTIDVGGFRPLTVPEQESFEAIFSSHLQHAVKIRMCPNHYVPAGFVFFWHTYRLNLSLSSMLFYLNKKVSYES